MKMYFSSGLSSRRKLPRTRATCSALRAHVRRQQALQAEDVALGVG
jgi:hypothetical protein